MRSGLACGPNVVSTGAALASQCDMAICAVASRQRPGDQASAAHRLPRVSQAAAQRQPTPPRQSCAHWRESGGYLQGGVQRSAVVGPVCCRCCRRGEAFAASQESGSRPSRILTRCVTAALLRRARLVAARHARWPLARPSARLMTTRSRMRSADRASTPRLGIELREPADARRDGLGQRRVRGASGGGHHATHASVGATSLTAARALSRKNAPTSSPGHGRKPAACATHHL